MRHPVLLALTTLLTAVVGVPVQVESLPSVPAGWKHVARANPSQPITLHIALTQPKLDLFERKLYSVSTPGSPEYGKHLTRREARDLMKPSPESSTAVLDWLRSEGLSDGEIQDKGDWVNIRVSVGRAEELLGTRYALYEHKGTGKRALRTLGYSVPDHVRRHLTMVQPTTRFGEFTAMRSAIFEVDRVGTSSSSSSSGSSVTKVSAATGDNGSPDAGVSTLCNATAVTPACLRALYKMGDAVAPQVDGAMLGVTGYLDQWAKYAYLDDFLAKFAPYAEGSNFSVALINGGVNDQNKTGVDDVEANLDIQYTAALGFQNELRFYSTGGRGELVPDQDEPTQADNSNEPYLEFLQYMLDLEDDELPQTLSTSYGDGEQTIPLEYRLKVCNMFMELGARGVSVIFSSGDDGPGSTCQSNDGKNTTKFDPTFPATCPYITSVGATFNFQPEEAASFSQGGFSDTFAQPAFQSAAVESYLASAADANKWAGFYNKTGRGFPDVAAQGVRYQVMEAGKAISVSGTSASAPAFAGIVSVLNAARMSKGEPPLGWLNPWLYSLNSGFTDIVNGRSEGCTGKDRYTGLPTTKIPGAGWDAVPGWDPVTGLGTPRFDELLEAAAPGVELDGYSKA